MRQDPRLVIAYEVPIVVIVAWWNIYFTLKIFKIDSSGIRSHSPVNVAVNRSRVEIIILLDTATVAPLSATGVWHRNGSGVSQPAASSTEGAWLVHWSTVSGLLNCA